MHRHGPADNQPALSAEDQEKDRKQALREKQIEQLRREKRLGWKPKDNERIANLVRNQALKTCDPVVGAFAQCMKETGLKAVTLCQNAKKDAEQCMGLNNNDAAREKAKDEELRKREEMLTSYENAAKPKAK